MGCAKMDNFCSLYGNIAHVEASKQKLFLAKKIIKHRLQDIIEKGTFSMDGFFMYSLIKDIVEVSILIIKQGVFYSYIFDKFTNVFQNVNLILILGTLLYPHIQSQSSWLSHFKSLSCRRSMASKTPTLWLEISQINQLSIQKL